MNELQIKAIEELKNKNLEYIKETDKLYKYTEKLLQKHKSFEDDFCVLMKKMEKANSGIPFVPFNNYYCIKKNDFGIPTAPLIINDLYGTLNQEFGLLSEEYMESMSKSISINADKLHDDLTDTANKISELLSKIIASNSITRRLSGLEDKFLELDKSCEYLWYPRELSKNEYSVRDEFIFPICLSGRNAQIQAPLHRELMINYDYLFKTKSIHLSITKKVEKILLFINEYLPFAELVPLNKSEKEINIYNTVSPKQTTIGSGNSFDGNIKIGSEEKNNDD